MKDKYSAVWVSHSSMSDYLKCPRAYYLNNVYKDSKTGHKITIMAPPLALGQAVHEVVESLSILPTNRRFEESLLTKFDKAWEKLTGKLGGFSSKEQEQQYKERGQNMLRRVQANPGPLKNLAVKINMDLPHYWLSEEENIILCGKIDRLEYFPDKDTVHIIDFKTSKKEEDGTSLQLPIYHLLVANCQKRTATKASYWYLEFADMLTERALPELTLAHEKVIAVARKVKLVRQLQRFECKDGAEGCTFCAPFEAVINGKAEFVGINDFKQDVYILHSQLTEEDSYIL